MYNAQSWPESQRELIILDDSTGPRWPSLPEKYRELVAMARGDVLAIWEDDDEYKSDHLAKHAQAIAGREWSKPSNVWSDYADPPRHGVERSDGRFFASIAFRRSLFDRVGGFVMTKRADFDQQFIARLTAAAVPGDPCDFGEPQYVFRWHTAAYHGQHYMRGPEDDGWYDRVPQSTAFPSSS
jgi:hypothetical protein